MNKSSALLIVDVQNDFCPGGALQVSEGDRVVPVLNRYIDYFMAKSLPIIATRDWHPRETVHFMAFGGVWPAHCVAGTPGAEFHKDLRLPKSVIVVSKGANPKQDAYSGFDAIDHGGKPLEAVLRSLAVTDLYIGGLATDYCVKATVLDGIRKGFSMIFLADAIAGVDLAPGDSERAIQEMLTAGARKMTIGEME